MQKKLWSQIRTLMKRINELERKERHRYYEEKRARAEEWREQIEKKYQRKVRKIIFRKGENEGTFNEKRL